MSQKTVGINNVNQQTGSATVTVNVAEGTNYLGANKNISVTSQFLPTYGVEYQGVYPWSQYNMTRLYSAANFTNPVPYITDSDPSDPEIVQGSSPFDTISPWKDMVVENRTAGKMVKIPKFYWKHEKVGSNYRLCISEYNIPGYSVCPICRDRGDGRGERSYAYVGAYMSNSANWKSESGKSRKCNITRAAARTGIHSLGSNIWLVDYSAIITLWMLELVEWATAAPEYKIGGDNGADDGTTRLYNTGITDALPYHTGACKDIDWQDIRSGRYDMASCAKYRNIEDLWSGLACWYDGIYMTADGNQSYDGKYYAINNPAQFSDSANGTLVEEYEYAGDVSTSDSQKDILAFNTTQGFEWLVQMHGDDYRGFNGTTGLVGFGHTQANDAPYFTGGNAVYCGGGNRFFRTSEFNPGSSVYQTGYTNDGFFSLMGFRPTFTNARIGCRVMELP